MSDGPAINMEMYRRAGGVDGRTFCGAPHPDNPDPEAEPDNFDYHWCRRLPHTDGDHAAFVHSIKTPERWL